MTSGEVWFPIDPLMLHSQACRVLALVASLVLAASPALAVGDPTELGGTYVDDDTYVHEAAIEVIAAAEITRGCNPPGDYWFCRDDSVTRAQVAAFMARVFSLPPAASDHFGDDDDSMFEADINAVAEAGITVGCNAPANTEYCPEDSVTREQMAAFLHRALPDLDVIHPEAGSFADVWGPVIDTGQPPVFYEDMAWLARTGVTVGCNPPTNTLFCPSDLVLRGQMASFLARASDLPQTEPLAPTLTEVLSITDGSRRPMGAPPDPLHRHVPWRGLGRLGHSSHR